MKRNLITQMKNEWRSNIWLLVELVVVMLAIWTILAVIYVKTSGLRLPLGYDPNDVYHLSINQVPSDSPDYVKFNSDEESNQAYYDDYAEMLRRFRANPNVEAVSCATGMEHYTYNYNGTSLIANGDTVYYSANQLRAEPDIIDVLRIQSLTGATPQQLKEMLRRGEYIVSDNPAYLEQGRDPMDLKGKDVFIGGDTTKTVRVGDVTHRMRRTDYENSFGGSIIKPIEEGKAWGNVLIRMKPGRGKAFEQEFENNPELRGIRNVYFSNLQSFDKKRFIVQYSVDTEVRTAVILSLFMLITIFLGLLGTFWFRMQQRTQEIAIRIVAGATRGQIFRRIIGEGMILLGVAAFIGSAIIWPFQFNGSFNMIDLEWQELLVLELISIAFVALGIVLSLLYPARRAMAIEPAIAIKDE